MILGKLFQYKIKKSIKTVLLLGLFLFSTTLFGAAEWQINRENLKAQKWVYLPTISHDNTHYIAVLTEAKNSNDSPELRVYKLSEEDGLLSAHWRYSLDKSQRAAGADFCISDLDDDGNPELALIYDINIEKDPEWLHIFEWDGENFSKKPVSSSRLLLDQSVRNRPGQIIFGHFENGKDKQLAILFRGSQRRVYTLSMEGDLNTAIWRKDKEFVSARFLEGNSELKILPFHLEKDGPSQLMFYTSKNAGTEFSLISLDKKGTSRELAFLQADEATAGNAIAVSEPRNTAKAEEGRIFFSTDRKVLAMLSYGNKKGLNLQGLKIDDDFAPESIIDYFKRSSKEFLLLAYNNTPLFNVFKYSGEQWALKENTRSRFSGKRLYGTTLNDGSRDRAFMVTSSPKKYYLELIDLNLKDADITQDTPETDQESLQIDELLLPGVENADSPLPIADTKTLTEELTYKITQYDYVFYVGDTFGQNVELGSIDPGNLQIKWDAPEGAIFNIKTGDINWTILEEQLDQQIFDLKIINKNDSSAYYWNIYINDIPQILNTQSSFIISIHQPFSLQLDMLDRNEDAELTYVLKDLAGGRISNNGLIEWNPGENDLDINIFSVLISDGFTVVEEKFMVYVNDPVRIISRPKSHILKVNTPWQYNLSSEDHNEEFLFQLSFSSKKILEDKQKQIEKFMFSEKVSVETEDKEKVYLDVRQNVKQIQIFNNKCFITLYQYDENIKFSEYLSGIFDLEYKLIPKYAVKQIKRLHYKLTESPARVELKNWGQVNWTPGLEELNSHIIEIEASDVISSDHQFLNLYVNSPPKITSPARAVVLNPGQVLTYKCQVEDLNTDARISFRLSDDSPPARLDQDGQLVWKVKKGQYDYDQLRIIASDDYDEAEILLMMYINDPVKIIPFDPLPAQVEKLWKQDLRYQDRNKSTLYRIVVEDPAVFANINERMSLFMSRQKVPVLHPVSNNGAAHEIDVRPAVKKLFSYGLNLFIEKDPNYTGSADLSDIFAGILERNTDYIPRHKKFHDKNVKFRSLSMPKGMELTENGKLRWQPTNTQIDTFNVILEASDAMSTDTLRFKLFSNSLPSVVSTPPENVHIGDEWIYPINVQNLNKNQAYEISLVESPENLVLKNSTLYWKPKISQKGSNTISFIVSDGHQNTAQTFNVFANAAPVIHSKPVIVGLTGFDYSYQIEAEDPNGDEIRFKAVDIPKWASLDEKTGLVKWEPRSGERGINRFVIEVQDSRNKITQHSFDVQVYEDPAAKKFSLAVFPIMLTVVGVILMAALL